MNWQQWRTNQSLYWRGIRWLWTREYRELDTDRLPRLYRLRGKYKAASTERPHLGIEYRKGWGPWRFLPVYLTSYLVSTLLGHPIRPFSAVMHERGSRVCRVINWITRDPDHCDRAARADTLWGSRGCW